LVWPLVLHTVSCWTQQELLDSAVAGITVIGADLGICNSAGLAGYVEYPTQELVSGLMPLNELQSINNLPTACLKPGQGLAGFNSTAIRDGMVRESQATPYNA
jgi:hypothetical protein